MWLLWWFLGFQNLWQMWSYSKVILLFHLSSTPPTTDECVVPVGFATRTWTFSLYNSGWLDPSCVCGGLPATRCRFLVDWLFKAPLKFPEVEERRKKRKEERSKQITREIKGAALLRFLVSSCVLLSHLVKSAVPSLYFLPLRNFSFW